MVYDNFMEEQTKNGNYNLWIGIGLVVLVGLGVFLNSSNSKPKSTDLAINTAEYSPSPTPTVTQAAIENVSDSVLKKHSTKDDCWVIVDGKVYDVTKIIPVHKGGEMAITNWCGKDASEAFNKRSGKGSHPSSAMEILTKTLMGLFEVKTN